MAHVSLRRVSKVYPGDVLAVNEAHLNVESREFLVIVGPSGC
ncbi:MAG: glycerol-3-phosphate ABC transporter ATP-binding protein, partial [Candidatus Omnitrophica bacterium]|nr:glycerol-3-phosphate ABC transporter ATP-binding protein [Candidatus Omnitrophota bacterium]